MKLKIKDMATVQMGYSFRSRLEYSKAGTISVIQMKNLLADNTVSHEELLKIEMQALKKHHFVKRGDLVFRSRGLITTSSIVLGNLDQAVVAAPLIRIRLTEPEKFLPEYLNWFINQNEAQAFLTSRAKGTTQKMISKQALEGLEVYLPFLEKQKKIVKMATLSFRETHLLKTIAQKRSQYIGLTLMQSAKGE
ncbi:MAG: restriction endonuclease subunit S [Deltaproteobacteria bacterium]|jgi:restriction endonuclease S subunit|nr:restriction endonuclease subunit S [Deltaproteobacteria bacterium]